MPNPLAIFASFYLVPNPPCACFTSSLDDKILNLADSKKLSAVIKVGIMSNIINLDGSAIAASGL